MPRISVVIPVYNRADLLQETLRSVLAQTVQDLEILVVDDGSDDHPEVAVRAVSPSIQVLHQSNAGAGPARNRGVAAATGEYVAFVDSDDLWLPTKLERQLDAIDSTKCSWVICDGIRFNHATGHDLGRFSDRAPLHAGDVLEPLFLRDFIPSPTPLVLRELLDSVGPFQPLPVAEDWDLWLRLAERAPLAVVPESLVRYRIHSGGTSAARKWRQSLRAEIAVVQAAAARNPARLQPLLQRAQARVYHRQGVLAAMSGELRAARRLFWRAIRADPELMPAYIDWMSSYFGGQPAKLLRAYRDKQQSRNQKRRD